MMIDFEKAFNTVSFDFIKKKLNFCNFRPMIIKWIDYFHRSSDGCSDEWFPNRFLPDRVAVVKVTLLVPMFSYCVLRF